MEHIYTRHNAETSGTAPLNRLDCISNSEIALFDNWKLQDFLEIFQNKSWNMKNSSILSL